MTDPTEAPSAAPEEEAPFFSIVIVTWNGLAWIETCLAALRRQRFRDFEIIVVDNGSEDGTPAAIATAWPEVRLLRQPTNLGFAAANNLGVAASRAPWVVLLNNDAFPREAWLDRLKAAIDDHPAYSGFASCQLQYGAPDRLDGAGDAYHRYGMPWRLGMDQPHGPPWDVPREILTPCAAAAAYRRDAYLSVGGFDERYFCYFEDVDLGLRMQLADHRFLYVPDAVVEHVGSGTQGRGSDFSRYHGHRNLVWTFVKGMPGRLFWRYLAGHLLLNVASLVQFTLRGEGGPVWRAKRDAIKALPDIWRERRRIQAGRVASLDRIDALLNHELAPLFSARKRH